MIIKLNELVRGRNNLSLAGSPEELGLPGDIFREPFQVRLAIDNQENLVKADISFRAVANLVCDRCAAKFQSGVEVRHQLYFIPSSIRVNSEDDIIYFHPDHPEVNISGDVRDLLMLSLPVKALCREECKGLCQRCGADLNYEQCDCSVERVDPRWGALEEIRQSLAKDNKWGSHL